MTVVDKAFEPDIEVLKARLRHWFRFDGLHPDQGIALLIGVVPEVSQLKSLANWGKDEDDDLMTIFFGFSLLNGEDIEVAEALGKDGKEKTEKAKKRIGDFARRHRQLLEYWRSGKHPEFPTPGYFVEWAKSKWLSPSWMAVAVELKSYLYTQLIEHVFPTSRRG